VYQGRWPKFALRRASRSPILNDCKPHVSDRCRPWTLDEKFDQVSELFYERQVYYWRALSSPQLFPEPRHDSGT
jgi:hypothetical protein